MSIKIQNAARQIARAEGRVVFEDSEGRRVKLSAEQVASLQRRARYTPSPDAAPTARARIVAALASYDGNDNGLLGRAGWRNLRRQFAADAKAQKQNWAAGVAAHANAEREDNYAKESQSYHDGQNAVKTFANDPLGTVVDTVVGGIHGLGQFGGQIFDFVRGAVDEILPD